MKTEDIKLDLTLALDLAHNAKRKEKLINFILNNWFKYFNLHNTYVSVYTYDLTIKDLKSILFDLIDVMIERFHLSSYKDEELEQIADEELGYSIELNFKEDRYYTFIKIVNSMGVDYEATNNENIVVFECTYKDYDLLSTTNKIQD